MLGVVTDDAVDFLSLLAIGYDELCWPEDHGKTPNQVHQQRLKEGSEAQQPLVAPLALKRWIESTFGRAVPETASSIFGEIADMGDETSNDPFWQWIQNLDPGSKV